ncbi:MAG TPA: MCE family protein [Mycobacteriales bacterium]|nr:MCE family protein [Mycobacteriales bacterium]
MIKLLRKRLLGVLFLAVVVGLLALSVAFYNKTFTTSVNVKLQAGRIGHQLVVPADVKLRGIIVGEVRSVHSNGTNATLDLALQPDKAKLIPSNVVARILPKTLFGEKFVDLIIPSAPAPTHFGQPGVSNVINLDHSSTAIEAEKVFNDLVPLLQTLQPVELNLTLSNLAQALRGRGNKLGDNLARTDTYFAALNPDLKNIEFDISGVADLATNLNAATPDLLATARQFAVNSRTLVQKSDVFTQFLLGTRGFANTTTNFLTQNGQNLVQLAQISQPQLALLAQYSPEFPCLLEGLTKIEPVLGQTFLPRAGQNPGLHIDLQVINQPNGYSYPKDKPDYTLNRNATFAGPHCYGLPGVPANAVGSPPPLNGGGNGPGGVSAQSSSQAVQLAQILSAPLLGVAGTDVPDIATILSAPQLAGMAVTVR